HSGIRPAHCAALCAGSELVVLVFEQDVERGERSAGRSLNRNSWIGNRGTPSPACSPHHGESVQRRTRRPRRVNLFRLKPATAGKLFVCRLHDQQEVAALSTVIDRRYKSEPDGIKDLMLSSCYT